MLIHFISSIFIHQSMIIYVFFNLFGFTFSSISLYKIYRIQRCNNSYKSTHQYVFEILDQHETRGILMPFTSLQYQSNSQFINRSFISGCNSPCQSIPSMFYWVAWTLLYFYTHFFTSVVHHICLISTSVMVIKLEFSSISRAYGRTVDRRICVPGVCEMGIHPIYNMNLNLSLNNSHPIHFNLN